ncbi:MAG: hypothetical protein V1779_16780 [bacterium]
MKKTILFLISLITLIGCNESTTPDNTGKNYRMVKWWGYFYENGSYGNKILAKVEHYSNNLIVQCDLYNMFGDIVGAETYEYDDDNYLTKISVVYEDNLYDDYYITYTYEGSRLIYKTRFNDKNKKWEESEYIYNEQNKIITELYTAYWGIMKEDSIIYFYDTSGNLIKKEFWDAGEEPFEINEFIYNSKNQLIEFILKTNMGDVVKEVNSYNSSGLLIEKIHYQDGEITGKFVYEYIY